MKMPYVLLSAFALCAAMTVSDRAHAEQPSGPEAPEIAESLGIRDRYAIARPDGSPMIYVDSVSVHHIRYESSTIVWKDEKGAWQLSQISEMGPGGLFPVERKLKGRRDRALTESEARQLDILVGDNSTYSEEIVREGDIGVGAPFHTMEIISPNGRRIVRWNGRLVGKTGAIADIILGHP